MSPPLIDRKIFDAVQVHLRARNPNVLPPRVGGCWRAQLCSELAGGRQPHCGA